MKTWVRGYSEITLLIYMYMYTYYCISDPKIFFWGGGGERKLGVGNPRAPPPLLYATLTMLL